ncbi:glycosyltransferase [Corynebacterium confusum]
MKFVGHTRFSLFDPTSSSWRISRSLGREDPSKYRNALFSEDRLKHRADIFFHHTLPTLDKAGEGHEFVHIVSYSADLPAKYRTQLEKQVEEYPWLVLDPRSNGKIRRSEINRSISRYVNRGQIFASYRLDDDDVLGTSFFDRASGYLEERFVGMQVSFGIGVQAFYGNGTFQAPRIEHRPKIAIGLLDICKRLEDGELKGPQPGAHTKADLRNPVIVDSRELAFIHTIHMRQDSGVDKPDADFVNRMKNYSRLPALKQSEYDEKRLTELFPTVEFGNEDALRRILEGHEGSKTLLSKSVRRVRTATREFGKLLEKWSGSTK